ncbi:FkbM family methyltransferase [Falsiroseomonas selenitidurans]|uniref:FkbM family methyltransferase n=1 Tax=Falsiroseomonas selenitidurans TaxID=2716335 RepID=A0ABX1E463_9PROT|nr:FkbM family methyltransferase [Falsiroseomonas selenitidurans]NKC31485.1 FkbM family methyltransferase [Falsiroseomonas selenitidurans]
MSHLARSPATAMPDLQRPRRVVPLGPGELLVESSWGGFMVVPAFNLDVAIGVTRDGVHEAWTTRLVQELLRPGDIYLNAGANFGYFVCLAGRMVGATGRVIGIEPNPHILPFLMKSLYWNGTIDNTEVIARALAEVADEAVAFHFDPQYLGGGAVLGPTQAPPADGARRDLAEALWTADSVGQLLDGGGRWIKGMGLMLPFTARSTTIDAVVAQLALPKLDLLHLDIEGSEPFALLGALQTLRASPRLKLITEWTAGHYRHGTPRLRAAFDAVWGHLAALGYRARLVQPVLAGDGGIHVSPPMTHAAMRETAPHGDYVWIKTEEDPFR